MGCGGCFSTAECCSCRSLCLNPPPDCCIAVVTPLTRGGRSAVSDRCSGLLVRYQWCAGAPLVVRRPRRNAWQTCRSRCFHVVTGPPSVAVDVDGGHTVKGLDIVQSAVVTTCRDPGPLDQLRAAERLVSVEQRCVQLRRCWGEIGAEALTREGSRRPFDGSRRWRSGLGQCP